ncbi:MAG: hypothetical protein AAF242_10975 [Bacteroidota bacterium]
MRILFIAIAFLFTATFTNATTPATSPLAVADQIDTGDIESIFVHISLHLKVTKKTPKGIEAEVQDIVLGKQEGKGIFTAKLRIVDGKAQFHLDRRPKKNLRVRMPQGFQLSDTIINKLGMTNSVVMSGGSTMLKKEDKNMLWFEIQ